jgi:hypothetical protein
MQTGPNSYLVTRTSAGGAFTNMSSLKAETIQAANKYAADRGKIAEGIGLREERPLQGFPSVEYQFQLTSPGNTKNTAFGIVSGGVERMQIEEIRR